MTPEELKARQQVVRDHPDAYPREGSHAVESRLSAWACLRSGYCPDCKARRDECECRDVGSGYDDRRELDFG